ncbi:MAG: hypothetical protein WC647_06365 [Desulfomonilaceae bacterium]|jgi:hypothetical protein
MKHLILAALILTPTLRLAADSDTYRNKDGDIVGDTSRPGDVINYTDKNGNYAGSETRYNNGKTVFRNKDGDIIGIINKDSD